jgi:hypothetical protein
LLSIINSTVVISSLVTSIYPDLSIAVTIALLGLRTQSQLAIFLLLLQSKDVMWIKLRRSISTMRLHIPRVPILLTIEALITASPISSIPVLAISPGVTLIA